MKLEDALAGLAGAVEQAKADLDRRARELQSEFTESAEALKQFGEDGLPGLLSKAVVVLSKDLHLGSGGTAYLTNVQLHMSGFGGGTYQMMSSDGRSEQRVHSGAYRAFFFLLPQPQREEG